MGPEFAVFDDDASTEFDPDGLECIALLDEPLALARERWRACESARSFLNDSLHAD